MATGGGFTAITPSDSQNNSRDTSQGWPDAVYFGTGGTARIVAPDNSVADFIVSDGQLLPVACKRINATGSSGIANIVGIYT